MQYILFDLDGTLTNPQEGITKSVAYALNYFGIPTYDLNSLNKYIGPPLRQSFMEFNRFTEEQSYVAMVKYREYFGPKGIFENVVYDGAYSLLDKLKNEGKHIILATSKPWIYAEQILEYFDLKKYFDFVSGSEMNGDRTDKADVIKYAIDRYGVDKTDAIMVGDRKHDITGAAKNGIKAIGVLYGFGSEKELKETGADYIAADMEEVYDIINKI